MKKTIFAVAVTAALGLTVANAETVLYGSVRLGVSYTKNHNAYTNVDPSNRPLRLDEQIAKNPELYAGLYAGTTTDLQRYTISQSIQRGAGRNAAYYNAETKTGKPGWVQDQQAKAGYFPNTYSLRNKQKYGFNVVDTGSRFGLKGGEDLGNGIKAIYQIEFGFNAAEGYSYGNGLRNRLAYVGLASEQFGTILIGRLPNPFHPSAVGPAIDNFNEVYIFGSAMAVNYVLTGGFNAYSAGGQYAGYDALRSSREDGGLSSRIGNAIAYVSPTWSGFSFNLAVAMDSPNDSAYPYGQKSASLFGDASTGVDLVTLNAKYVHESGVMAGLGYLRSSRIGNRGTRGAAIDQERIDAENAGRGNSWMNSYTDDLLGNHSESLSVKSNLYAMNVGFANDMFKVGLDVATGSGKTENLVRTNYYTPEYTDVNGNTVAATSRDSWNIVKASHRSTGWDLGGKFMFNEGMTSVLANVGRMTGKSKESRANTNNLTNSAWTSGSHATNGSAVNFNTGAWNDHKNVVTTWALGFEHKLSQRTKAWVEYEGAKMTHKQVVEWATRTFDAAGSYTGRVNWQSGERKISDRQSRINVGIRHDF